MLQIPGSSHNKYPRNSGLARNKVLGSKCTVHIPRLMLPEISSLCPQIARFLLHLCLNSQILKYVQALRSVQKWREEQNMLKIPQAGSLSPGIMLAIVAAHVSALLERQRSLERAEVESTFESSFNKPAYDLLSIQVETAARLINQGFHIVLLSMMPVVGRGRGCIWGREGECFVTRRIDSSMSHCHAQHKVACSCKF